MSDFHQRGLISTLPRLISPKLDDLEIQLASLARTTPVALILPCTLDDLHRPAMGEILRQTKKARYFTTILISLNQASAADLPAARRRLPDDPRFVLLWNDHPALADLFPGAKSGKGYNLWTALGWLLETGNCQAIVSHDSDILQYSRELPALLALPLLDPAFHYRFVKGYYPRLGHPAGSAEKTGGQLFGRVTRLFVGPLLRALIRVEGHTPLLDFLDSFRYPLAGEFGARLSDLAQFSLPTGWDLEMDLLSSVHRILPPESVAQIDLGSNYEHKHRDLAPGPVENGLTQIAAEISASLFRQLARDGTPIAPDFLNALCSAYEKTARDTIRRYRHVALFNRLDFSETHELALIDAFSAVLHRPLPPTSAPLIAWSELRRTQPARCAEFTRHLTSENVSRRS